MKALSHEKQNEVRTEKDNEGIILRHQCYLKQRLKELNAEAMRMRHEQELVSQIGYILVK